MKSLVFLAAVGGVLIILVPFLLDLVCRVSYPVPAPGSALVITGASTGIGHDAGLSLANKGYVVYAGVRSQKDFDKIKGYGIPNLVPAIIDVTKQDTIDNFYTFLEGDLRERRVELTGLVNNAGIGLGGVLEFSDLQDAQLILDVNYLGVLRVTKKLIPLIRKAKGRIINISSLAGFQPLPMTSFYAASKHALEGWSDSLRLEMRALNVSVTTVRPGAVVTPIFQKFGASAQAPERVKLHEQAAQVYGHLYNKPLSPDKLVKMSATTEVTTVAIEHAYLDPYPKPYYEVAGYKEFHCRTLLLLKKMLPPSAHDAFLMNLYKH